MQGKSEYSDTKENSKLDMNIQYDFAKSSNSSEAKGNKQRNR